MASSNSVGEAIRVREQTEVPDVDKWRVGYLAILLKQRMAAYYSADEEEKDRLSMLINSLAI